MKLHLKRGHVEMALFLLVVFLAFLYGYAPFGGTVDHSYPAVINAGDPVTRVVQMEWILQSQRYFYNAPWFLPTGNNGILISQPPNMLLSAASLSLFSGLGPYDSVYLIENMVVAGLALGFFALFRYFYSNRFLAAASALLLIMPLESQYLYPKLVGFIGSFETILLVPYILMAFLKFKATPGIRNTFLLALLLSFQLMLHGSAALLLLGILSAYFVLSALDFRELSAKKAAAVVLPIAKLLAVFLLLGGFYIWVSSASLVSDRTFASFFGNANLDHPPWEPRVSLANFLTPLYYGLFLFGAAAVFFMRKTPYLLFLVLGAFYIAVVFVLPAFGIGDYYTSIRMRYLVYPYFYALVAVGLWVVSTAVAKNVGLQENGAWKNIVLIALLVFVGYNVLSYSAAAKGDGGGLFSRESYDFYRQLEQAIPDNKVSACIGCTQWEQLVSHRFMANLNQFSLADLSTGASDRLGDFEFFGFEYTVLKYKPPLGIEKVKVNNEEFIRDGMLPNVTRLCSLDYLLVKANPKYDIGQLNAFLGRLAAHNNTLILRNDFMLAFRINKEGPSCI